MVEAAASGCIDYSKADSHDHKFLLKELWICEHLRSQRLHKLLEANLATKRQLIPLGVEALDDYSDYMDRVFKKSLFPWMVESSSNDVERYRELFGGVDQEEVERLNKYLDRKAAQTEQQQDYLKHLQLQADKLVAENFKRRIG